MNSTYKGPIESLKDFWESRSTSFEKDYSIRSEGISEIAKKIEKLIEGRRLLEIGCGPGILAGLYPKNTDVVGLDFSISMLETAKSRIRQLVLADTLNLPFQNGVFEIVTCFFVASDYFAKEEIFQEACRVLETKGLFLFADYSPRDQHWKFRREIRPILGEDCSMHIEDAKTLSHRLKSTGFNVQTAKFIRFNAEFRVERYVKSNNELERLKKGHPQIWKRLEHCTKSGVMRREFILLVSKK